MTADHVRFEIENRVVQLKASIEHIDQNIDVDDIDTEWLKRLHARRQALQDVLDWMAAERSAERRDNDS